MKIPFRGFKGFVAFWTDINANFYPEDFIKKNRLDLELKKYSFTNGHVRLKNPRTDETSTVSKIGGLYNELLSYKK